MRKYKILVSDYDGTLAGSDHKISDKNLSAINGFISRGGIFVLSSGRATDGISKILLQQGFKGMLSSFNGAVLYDLNEKKVLCSKLIPTDVCVRLLDYCAKNNVYVQFYEESGFAYPYRTKRTDYYEVVTGVKGTLIENQVEYANEKGVQCPKLLIFDEKEVLDAHFNAVKDLMPECEVVRSTDNMIDFNLKGVNKGSSLDLIAESFGATISDIVAVGDAGNDFAMIERAGLSVAVANATDEIKAESDIVLSLSNDQDAVAYLIENYCI